MSTPMVHWPQPNPANRVLVNVLVDKLAMIEHLDNQILLQRTVLDQPGLIRDPHKREVAQLQIDCKVAERVLHQAHFELLRAQLKARENTTPVA